MTYLSLRVRPTPSQNHLRLKSEYELLVTNRLILQPLVEANLYGRAALDQMELVVTSKRTNDSFESGEEDAVTVPGCG